MRAIAQDGSVEDGSVLSSCIFFLFSERCCKAGRLAEGCKMSPACMAGCTGLCERLVGFTLWRSRLSGEVDNACVLVAALVFRFAYGFQMLFSKRDGTTTKTPLMDFLGGFPNTYLLRTGPFRTLIGQVSKPPVVCSWPTSKIDMHYHRHFSSCMQICFKYVS